MILQSLIVPISEWEAEKIGNIFNNEFRDFITALNHKKSQVRFAGRLLRYFARVFAKYRPFGHLVNKTADNYSKLKSAFFELECRYLIWQKIIFFIIKIWMCFPFIDLIKAKKSSGRFKDQDDIANLNIGKW